MTEELVQKINRIYTGQTIEGYRSAIEQFNRRGMTAHLFCYKCKRAGCHTDDFVSPRDTTPLEQLVIVRDILLDGKLIVNFYLCSACVNKLRGLHMTGCCGKAGALPKLVSNNSMPSACCAICNRLDGDISWIADSDEHTHKDTVFNGKILVGEIVIAGQSMPVCNECKEFINITRRIDFSGGGVLFIPPDTYKAYKDKL